ncbi:response regulator [Paenibacillus sp. MWE-103]|uniref:Response regulator n=1 Tax=Paenibacillus artemisiicola TaxID=1172618 RepID=A0ABS3W800_9BACL|nr:response regulator [Paenibacillus artemisiicola]MBO7744441.1 response regulator [Paenibacillus artemisiicola]
MIKLLIVDDETVERRALCRSVDWSLIGSEVIGDAWNGKQAVDMAMQSRPDIIITDVKMPVMDGVEMARMVSAIDPAIKIIFCSAYEEFGYAREAANLNAFGYVLKPINDEELLRVVKKAADKCIEERMQGAIYERLRNNLSLSGPVLRESVVRSALLGINEEPESLLQGIGLDWLLEVEGHICLLLISWDRSVKIRSEEIKSAFHNIVPEWKNAVCAKLSASEIAVVFRSHALPSDVSLLLSQASRQMVDHIRQSLGLELQTVYRIYPGTMTLEEAYLDASRQVGRGAANSLSLTGSDPGGSESAGGDYTAVSEALLQLKEGTPRLLRQGGEQELDGLVDLCLDEQHWTGDPSFVCGVGLSVLSVLVDATRGQGFEPFAGIDEEIGCWSDLARKRTAADIRDNLHHRVRLLIRKIRNDKQEVEDPLIAQIKHIVSEHYGTPLSVESIAGAMHFTPNYLGAAFKAKMSISLNDYINKYRITVSMGLLRDPSLSIHEVAKLSGYENTPYYHRMFKKHTGMTPGDYRLTEKGPDDACAE